MVTSCCLSILSVWCLLMGNVVFVVDALLCQCTEQDCLSQGRSNMCKGDPNLGCYKEYYSKRNPPVTMGCVRYSLLCDQSKMRPEQFNSDQWPYTKCCFSDLCNRNLTIPPLHHKSDAMKKSTEPQTVADVTTYHMDTIVNSGSDTALTEEDNSNSSVHPVLLLLIALVVLFLIVVFASILVIIKIWLYRRRKPKEMQISCNNWKNHRYIDSHTQTTYLLTSKDSNSSQETSSNTLLQAFDVP